MFGLRALTQRLEALEERVDTLEGRPATPEETGERDTAARLQAGIDSIMGYEGPLAGRAGEEA